MADKLFGKYRGTVINNIDPMQIGRLMVQVPDVSNILPSTWAMPCVPFAGNPVGDVRRPADRVGGLDRVRAGEHRLPDLDGMFLGLGRGPAGARARGSPRPPEIVIQSVGQNTLMLSDHRGPPGGILLKSTSGAMIAINDIGITISNGQGATIVMTGPSITVNEGALEIV